MLIIYGNPSRQLLESARALFQHILLCGNSTNFSDGESMIHVGSLSELKHLDLRANVILCLCPPDPSETRRMGQALMDSGVLLSLEHYPRLETARNFEVKQFIRINPQDAYRGQLARWLSTHGLLHRENEPRLYSISGATLDV